MKGKLFALILAAALTLALAGCTTTAPGTTVSPTTKVTTTVAPTTTMPVTPLPTVTVPVTVSPK